MRVIIFAATGMVGKGVLLECLDAARIDRVLLVSRHPIDVSHPQLREIVHQDFFDFVSTQSQFVDVDACFLCLGVSSVGISEPEYHHLTYDPTLAAATALASVAAPRLTFCYVSAEGTDSTERGRAHARASRGRRRHQVEDAMVPGSLRRDGTVLSPLSPVATAVCNDNREYGPADINQLSA